MSDTVTVSSGTSQLTVVTQEKSQEVTLQANAKLAAS